MDIDASVRFPATIRVAVRYPASARRVFDAWLDPAFAAQWLFATACRPAELVEIDARVAGRFCFVDRRGRSVTAWRGEYVEIAPPRRLVFTLQLDGDAPVLTRVDVRIGDAPDGCELVLAHAGVPAARVRALGDRWSGLLYGLGAALDADVDPVALSETAP